MFCSKCGTKYPELEGAKFCSGCGAIKVVDTANVEPTLTIKTLDEHSVIESTTMFISKPTLEPQSTDVDSMYKRALLLMENKDFNKASQLFDQVLNLQPENARAYIGQLLAEQRLTNEEQLAEHINHWQDNSLFQRAVRFADDTYKAILEEYAETAHVNLIIHKAKEMFLTAVNPSAIIMLLEPLRGNETAEKLLALCKTRDNNLMQMYIQQLLDTSKCKSLDGLAQCTSGWETTPLFNQIMHIADIEMKQKLTAIVNEVNKLNNERLAQDTVTRNILIAKNESTRKKRNLIITIVTPIIIIIGLVIWIVIPQQHERRHESAAQYLDLYREAFRQGDYDLARRMYNDYLRNHLSGPDWYERSQSIAYLGEFVWRGSPTSRENLTNSLMTQLDDRINNALIAERALSHAASGDWEMGFNLLASERITTTYIPERIIKELFTFFLESINPKQLHILPKDSSWIQASYFDFHNSSLYWLNQDGTVDTFNGRNDIRSLSNIIRIEMIGDPNDFFFIYAALDNNNVLLVEDYRETYTIYDVLDFDINRNLVVVIHRNGTVSYQQLNQHHEYSLDNVSQWNNIEMVWIATEFLRRDTHFTYPNQPGQNRREEHRNQGVNRVDTHVTFLVARTRTGEILNSGQNRIMYTDQRRVDVGGRGGTIWLNIDRAFVRFEPAPTPFHLMVERPIQPSINIRTRNWNSPIIITRPFDGQWLVEQFGGNDEDYFDYWNYDDSY
ncbi:MAG: hypothetical protein FWE90_00590 [Defluviitaleaceae bacterium]|nr:hypothetical protein [Defluviitaleaceae bacterium]